MRRSFHQRILWLVILGTFLGLVCQNDVATKKNSQNIVSQTPQPSESAPKIVIDGMNPSLDWEACPWDNGTGTIGNPYILKDLVIDAGGVGSGILIQNTRDYFQIQNCTVRNSESTGAGISLYNVTWGTLVNNSITSNLGNGLYMENAHNCSILANNITQNEEHGIELYNTDQNNFTGNRLILNRNYAFYTQYADNCTVQDNYFDRNYAHAFRWCYGQYSNFTGNAIFNQTGDSIDLFTSNYNLVTGNWGNNDSGGVSVRESRDNIVTDNNFTAIGFAGIALDTSNRTYCANNMLSGGSFGISIVDDAWNNSILENNCSNALYGLSISNSKDTIVGGNHFVKCGIRLQCILTQIFSQSINADNDVDGNLVRVYENQTGVTIPVDTGQAILVNCSASNFENAQSTPVIYSFYFTNHSLVRNCTVAGLDLYNTANNTLFNNTVSPSYRYSAATRVYYSEGINITENDLHGINATYGIYLYLANNNTIHHNNCSLINGYAIYIESSRNNSITNNSCDGNGISVMFRPGGLYVDGSSNNNSVLWNNCSRNPYMGLQVRGVGNLVAYNNVAFSGWVGLYVGGGPNTVRDNKCWQNGLLGSMYMPAGIQFSASAGGFLTNNECWDNVGNGITVGNTYFGNISDNRCWSNDLAGIRVGTNAYNCVITRNLCYSNSYPGIQVSQSYYCTISENYLYWNGQSNIEVGGSAHDIYVINNTVINGYKHGIAISSASNTTVIGNNCTTNDEDGITITGGSNYTIVNNNCSGHTTWNGIYVSGITLSSIAGNTVTSNFYGIRFESNANDNNITDNNATGNSYGIWLSTSCVRNTISRNYVTGGTGGGINVVSSDNTTLANNTCVQNSGYGLRVSASYGCNVTNNYVCFNQYGINSFTGGSNFFSWNNCTNNTGYGISLETSDNNEVCYNLFRNNTGEHILDTGANNFVHHNFFGDGPYAYFTTNATYILEGQWISFMEGSFGGAPPYIYNWSFGDQSINSTLQAPPPYLYSNDGTYTLTLLIEDTNHAISNYSIDIVVAVDISPVALFSVNDTDIIAGQWVLFEDKSTPGNGLLAYQWNFGDGPTNATTQNITHQFNSVNTFTVILTVNDTDGDISVHSEQVTVVADLIPIANFTANKTYIRVNQWVCFNDTSKLGNDGLSYQWNFGDGPTNATTQNVTHQFTSASMFTVILTVNDTDGDISVHSLQITVTVDTVPTASFIANKSTIYEGELILFNDTSTAGNLPIVYQWNFGDGPTNGTTQNVTHQFASAGIFTVILTVNDTDGDVSVFSLLITVNNFAPIASFTENYITIFEGQWVQFNDTSTGGNRPLAYQWNFGDGPTNATIQNVTHQFNSASVFTVILTVNDTDGDISVSSLQITVEVDPTNYSPTISSLPNLSYQSGSTGHVVSILVTDNKVSNPTLTIYLDGVIVLSSQPWVSKIPFQLTIDGLSVGTHLYRVVAADGLGASSVAYFNVTVLPDLLQPLWIILGIAIPALILGAILYSRRFKRPRNRVPDSHPAIQVVSATIPVVKTESPKLPSTKPVIVKKSEPKPAIKPATTPVLNPQPKMELKGEPAVESKNGPKLVPIPSQQPTVTQKLIPPQSPASPTKQVIGQKKEITDASPGKPKTRKATKKSKKPTVKPK